MSQRVSVERVAEIKAELERDPYANIPDSAFRQAGAFRPSLDDVPVELVRADVRDLIADLEEAREQRWVLREALEGTQYDYYPASRRWYCVGCNATKGEPHRPECQIEKALAATETGNG